jgi:GH43 family beta-xylosidase
MTKGIIHVSAGQIRRNYGLAKQERFDLMKPVIHVREDGVYHLVSEVVIYGQDGLEAARVKYSVAGLPEAENVSVWIETENKLGYQK